MFKKAKTKISYMFIKNGLLTLGLLLFAMSGIFSGCEEKHHGGTWHFSGFEEVRAYTTN